MDVGLHLPALADLLYYITSMFEPFQSAFESRGRQALPIAYPVTIARDQGRAAARR
jgi:hypothetical protein